MNCNDLQEGVRGSRYVVKRPKALQWFYKGRLYKASDEERQAGRFELFLDLLYVAIVANFSDDLAEHANGAHLAKYILIFAPAWHIWADLREIMNSYYTDDLIQRLVILWVMALLVLYANNARLVDEDIGAMRTTAGAYVVARFSTMCVFVISSFASYHHRTQARIMAGFMCVGLLITIPLFFESVSIQAKAAVVAVMIFYQECTWALTLSPWIKRRLKLRYSTAVDIAHEIDRMAAFFIIILGEFVYSVIVGDPAGVGLTSGYAKAVFTLIIAFCLNWLYVSGDGSVQATHPIRRSAWTAFGFFLLHLPLSASFLIGGHICAISTKLHEFEDGQQWLLGGGLGVGLFCLWVYGMLYRTEDEDCLILPKYPRIGMRLIVAIILIVLPETHDHLNTTQFMAVVMSLVAFLTVWETVGGLLKGATFFEPWTDIHEPPEEVLEEGSDSQIQPAAATLWGSRIGLSSAIVATATAGVYAALIYRRVSATPLRTITSADTVSETFAKSATIRELVNPRGHFAWCDSRSVTLELPRRESREEKDGAACDEGVSDQALLASFVKGFFGGRVFALERIGLGVLQLQPGAFKGLTTTPDNRIWNTAELSNETLPPLSTTIFGAFQVAAVDIADHSNPSDSTPSPEESTTSTVDVLYGSSESRFAGCHRFSVRRDGHRVRIALECVTCNPTVDKQLSPAFLFWFHRAYAMLLFQDAVANVKHVAQLS
ncbi:low temperature requirement protein A [Purpureocillium lavendulum]|uniref:Low temperature requirement protein A n=1 Tax=Purpureocillium lavendulum TaxID=1247861 RepID=A0AB34FP07_9HYPO|nr:low temperature requirement protein A [Purpureocillium lavendulum]